jgi:hypothetical protein
LTVVGVEHEAPRDLVPGRSDAVTLAFSDMEADICGVARIGRALDGDGDVVTSGLAILFAGGQPVSVRAEGGVPAGEGVGWGEAEAAGVWTEIVDPLRAWRFHYEDEEGANAFLLDVEAVSVAASLSADEPAGKLGGMEGYDQLVKVTGTVTVGGTRRTFTGRGQRGHSWGAPDWERIALARTVGAWLGDDLAVSLTAIRPAGAKHHEDERVAATILDHDPDTDAPRATPVVDPRLSTTYDADGRQLAAGLELFVDDDGLPRRAAGEVACGTTLDLGRLTLHCAFFRWRMEGRTGVGRYDVLARAS